MNYRALKEWLESAAPNGLTDTDQVLADWANAEVINEDVSTISSGEIFAAILDNVTEWTTLAPTDKELIKDILYIHSGEGVPTAPGSSARAILVSKLGTNTKATLAAKLQKAISRAQDMGFPPLEATDIEAARTK